MRNALLIIGPTGSGKTPLGDYLEANGLEKTRCHHFDFGANLRAASGTDLSESDMKVVDDVLNRGALLEDDTFHIAKTILEAFINSHAIKDDDLVVLNGLPRHVGQAEAMSDMIRMKFLICLDCSPEVVRERIRLNSGGDRTDRTDDSLEFIEEKLRIFVERTAPLVKYYSQRNSPVVHLDVTAQSTPADAVAAIAMRWQ